MKHIFRKTGKPKTVREKAREKPHGINKFQKNPESIPMTISPHCFLRHRWFLAYTYSNHMTTSDLIVKSTKKPKTNDTEWEARIAGAQDLQESHSGSSLPDWKNWYKWMFISRPNTLYHSVHNFCSKKTTEKAARLTCWMPSESMSTFFPGSPRTIFSYFLSLLQNRNFHEVKEKRHSVFHPKHLPYCVLTLFLAQEPQWLVVWSRDFAAKTEWIFYIFPCLRSVD